MPENNSHITLNIAPHIKSFTALVVIWAASTLSLASSDNEAPQKNETVNILITSELTEHYEKFLDGRELSTIRDYTNPRGRQMAELVLFQQALILAKYPKKIVLQEAKRNDYRHNINEVVKGNIAAMGVTNWRVDAKFHQNTLFTSSPIIEDGQYQVGLYTRSDNKAIRSVTSLPELEQFTAISSQDWSADWRTMNSLPLKKLYDSDSWISHLKMLISGRADFMLLPIQNTPDLSIFYNPNSRSYLDSYLNENNIDLEGIHLLPIPNIKIQIAGERCFFISRKHPDGEELAKALDIGLGILREQGLIEKALTDSKFFHSATKDWTVINQSNQYH